MELRVRIKEHSNNKIHLFFQMIRLNHLLTCRNPSISKAIKYLITLQSRLLIIISTVFNSCHSLQIVRLMMFHRNKNINFQLKQRLINFNKLSKNYTKKQPRPNNNLNR